MSAAARNPRESEAKPAGAAWRSRLHDVIFEADTPLGKAFDIVLLAAILLSVAVVVLDSVSSVKARFHQELVAIEWLLTVLFTLEYFLRLCAVRRPIRYVLSFYGVVDLLSILPTYISLFYGGAQAMLIVRTLRLLRIFRIFKLARYVTEMSAMARALRATRQKIAVFLFVLATMVLIMGTALYVIEGHENPGFSSIPLSVYWAIVTVTTVGYGDIAPQTHVGRALAAVAMLLGYSLIIIPTGVFTSELVQAARRKVSSQHCPECSREGHEADAVFCKFCGGRL